MNLKTRFLTAKITVLFGGTLGIFLAYPYLAGKPPFISLATYFGLSLLDLWEKSSILV